jgi:hypothetical protein
MSHDFLEMVSTVIGVGDHGEEMIQQFSKANGYSCTDSSGPLAPEEGLLWTKEQGVQKVVLRRPQARKQRHARKYAEGELGEDKTFYFRGPRGDLRLRAQNLVIFLQLTEGVDDQTWLHHLRAGEYSRWFEEAIKDPELAIEASAIEQDKTYLPRVALPNQGNGGAQIYGPR